MLDGRGSDLQAQLRGGGLEIGGLGGRFPQQGQHEHPQQTDGGELAMPLDHPRSPTEFLDLGPENLLQRGGGLLYDGHWETPSSSTRGSVTTAGIGVSHFSCQTNLLSSAYGVALR